MSRRTRFAALGAALLLAVASGATFANRGPSPAADRAAPASSHGSETPEGPSAADLAHAAERLAANDVLYDDAQLAELAGRYGLGGAVRVLAWSDATGLSVDEITAMRDGADGEPTRGWGRIAKDLGVHPGLGSIMGNGKADGGVHGRENAPGQSSSDSGD